MTLGEQELVASSTIACGAAVSYLSRPRKPAVRTGGATATSTKATTKACILIRCKRQYHGAETPPDRCRASHRRSSWQSAINAAHWRVATISTAQ